MNSVSCPFHQYGMKSPLIPNDRSKQVEYTNRATREYVVPLKKIGYGVLYGHLIMIPGNSIFYLLKRGHKFYRSLY